MNLSCKLLSTVLLMAGMAACNGGTGNAKKQPLTVRTSQDHQQPQIDPASAIRHGERASKRPVLTITGGGKDAHYTTSNGGIDCYVKDGIARGKCSELLPETQPAARAR